MIGECIMLDNIKNMLALSSSNQNVMPPTILFNEGWLLRLLLDWFSGQHVQGHPLSFPENGKWFSEALLPTAFLPRSRKDPLGEACRDPVSGLDGLLPK